MYVILFFLKLNTRLTIYANLYLRLKQFRHYICCHRLDSTVILKKKKMKYCGHSSCKQHVSKEIGFVMCFSVIAVQLLFIAKLDRSLFLNDFQLAR